MAAQSSQPLDKAVPVSRTRTDPDRLQAFSQRLNLMLDELGQPERSRARFLKERVGVSGTTAANWLRGQGYPSFEELSRLGRLGVDLSRLFPQDAAPAWAESSSLTVALEASGPLAALGRANVIFSLPQLESDDGEWNHTAFPSWIWSRVDGRSLDGFVVFFMNGDAMADRIKEGTPLLIDTNATQVQGDNAIYALLLGETLIVRRVQRRLQGGYRISADNPAIAPDTVETLVPHTQARPDTQAPILIGRVVFAIERL